MLPESVALQRIGHGRSSPTTAAQKAQRERAERQQAEFAAKRDAEHRRLLRRIRALPPAQDGVPALALALARDPDSRLARSSRRLDEMLSGAGVYHPIRGEETPR